MRNPWARIVSAYLNKFRSIDRVSKKVIRSINHQRTTGQKNAHLREDLTFREFATYVAGTDPNRCNEHWRPQHLFLGENQFDFIGRFENLASDFDIVRQRLGIDLALPYCNATAYSERAAVGGIAADLAPRAFAAANAIPSYQQFYTPELIDLVAKIYADDIRRFGYEFDPA